MPTFVPTGVVQRAIERGDYVRRPAARLSDHSGHKEWFHFCVSTRDMDVLVNFSIMDDSCSEGTERAESARLTCAVRTDGWDGDIDTFESHEVTARPGRIDVRLGESRVEYVNGTYRVVARMRRRPIDIELTLYPFTIPSQVNNILLGDGPPLQWFLVPRLAAFGEVRLGDERIEVTGAPGYHDHNWGYFRWGQDFSWIWGYGHGQSLGSPWTIAFDRLMDRARSTDIERGLLLWKGKNRHRLFRGSELRVTESGFLRSNDVLRLPRVMALVRPAAAVDVPATLHGRAEGRGDVLEFLFSGRHVCQLIAPNDDDLSATVISEVSGDLRLSGMVRGERIEMDGRAMFEFLGD